jgi:hypothetical protein
MAIEFVVQRLQIGDVILIDLPEGGGQGEATVARAIERSAGTVRVELRAEGLPEFVREWAVDDRVTVVRGP